MARTKTTELVPTPKDTVKDPNCVKHGCCSCTNKDTDLSKYPCKECGPKHNWQYWQDANPGKPY